MGLCQPRQAWETASASSTDTSPPGDEQCGQGVLLSQMWRVSTRTRLDVSQKEGPHQAVELSNGEEHVHQNIELPEDTAWGF